MKATVIGWLLTVVIAAAAMSLHEHALLMVVAVWLAWLIGRTSMLPRFGRRR